MVQHTRHHRRAIGYTGIFPAQQKSWTTVRDFAEDVFAVQLQQHHDDDSLTLGHGLVTLANPKTTDDIRNHPFYGNHNAVARTLDALQKACLDF
jgi:hypothetical protein